MTDERLVWQELIESEGWRLLEQSATTILDAERLLDKAEAAFEKYAKRETQTIELGDLLAARKAIRKLLAYPQTRIQQLDTQQDEAARQAAIPHGVRRRA